MRFSAAMGVIDSFSLITLEHKVVINKKKNVKYRNTVQRHHLRQRTCALKLNAGFFRNKMNLCSETPLRTARVKDSLSLLGF